MKSYMSADQMRLVGKAWEIHHHLRQMISSIPSHAPLQEVLANQRFHSSASLKRIQQLRIQTKRNSHLQQRICP